MKKILALLLCVLMVVGLIGCSTPTQQEETPAPSETPAAEEAGLYTPGTYTATARGFGGDVTVTVTVDANAITDVTAVGDAETAGIGSNAIEQLPAAILEAQSVEVDTVAGCTMSSNAVLDAAAEALAQARGEGEAAAVASFTPGTYTATAQGHNGAVTVETTFSADRIESIEVVNHFESQGVSDKAILTELPVAIIENQSLAVDTIAGATVSSNAVISAVRDCAEQAGCDTSALMTAPEKADPTEIDMTADVIIVGGGGAGLSAAVAATDLGASVIIVEKEGYVGGNTLVSGGIFNAPDPEMQKDVEMTAGVTALVETALAETPVSEEHADLIAAVQADYDAWKAEGSVGLFDSVNWFCLQTWNAGDKVADLELLYNMCDHAYDTLVWLSDMGWTYQDEIKQGAGSLYQRTHSSVDHAGVGFINAFTSTLEEREGVEIVFNTTAEELVMEDGVCVGVKATDRDGNTYTFNANDGVVLATGGFGRNKEMIQEYNTSGKWPDLSDITCTNMPGITGDGIRMAEAVGAALRDMDQIQLLQTTQPGTGNCVYAYVAPQEAAGYLFFNQEGHRFIGEDGRRDDISLAALDQTDALFYMLESADVITDPENTYDLLGVPMTECINAGAIIVGDTLEELCEKLDWDYETVQAEVDSYNANVEANAVSDEYGRALFTIKQENGPWYAIPRTPSIHHTMGGVVINTDTQVLDTEGNVIPGLYAAGEVTGGIHGANRVGGNALVDCITYGRIAGDSAVTIARGEQENA